MDSIGMIEDEKLYPNIDHIYLDVIIKGIRNK